MAEREYPDFVESTGYGTGEGLGGWNCRHSFSPYFEGMPRTWTDEKLKKLNEPKYTYNGKKLTEEEARAQQRYIERQIRRWKRENVAMQAAGQDTTQSAVKLKQWQEREEDFLRQTGLKRSSSRSHVEGFGYEEAKKAAEDAKTAGTASMEKPIIDVLEENGVKYKQRISDRDILVDADRPSIMRMSGHAAENQVTKEDRADMTLERAQSFVNNAKLVLYQPENKTLKYMASDGYAVLNFDHELVTAVPQKWRKKYNQYIEEDDS